MKPTTFAGHARPYLAAAAQADMTKQPDKFHSALAHFESQLWTAHGGRHIEPSQDCITSVQTRQPITKKKIPPSLAQLCWLRIAIHAFKRGNLKPKEYSLSGSPLLAQDCIASIQMRQPKPKKYSLSGSPLLGGIYGQLMSPLLPPQRA